MGLKSYMVLWTIIAMSCFVGCGGGSNGSGSANNGTEVNNGEATNATESDLPDFDAANFSNPTTIDNEWFPLKPGTRFIWDGTSVDEDPVSVNDLFCSICHSLKVNPETENMSPLGRPMKIVDGGKVVDKLFA